MPGLLFFVNDNTHWKLVTDYWELVSIPVTSHEYSVTSYFRRPLTI